MRIISNPPSKYEHLVPLRTVKKKETTALKMIIRKRSTKMVLNGNNMLGIIPQPPKETIRMLIDTFNCFIKKVRCTPLAAY